MQLAAAIVLIGGLVFLAHLFAAIFSRTRIPDVLWLLLIGVGLGPVLHVMSPASFGVVGPAFVAITLVLILFESGLSLQYMRLRQVMWSTLLVTGIAFAGQAALIGLVTTFLTPLGPWQGFLLGAILAGNSPSVIAPLARGLGIETHVRDVLFLESALGDVASIVLALALVDFHFNGWGRWALAGGHFLLGLTGAVLLGGAGGLAWAVALRKTRGLENPMFTTPAFVFLIYGGAELLHANGPIAVLVFGIVLGNASQTPLVRDTAPAVGLNRAELVFLGEIVFLLKTFFFVYIGLSVKFTDMRWLLFGGALTLLLPLPRLGAVRAGLGRDIANRDAALAACMIPKGLAAAVLASLLAERAVPGAEALQSIVYAVVFFGVVLTSLLVFTVARPGGTRAMAWLLGRPAETVSELEPQ